MSKHLITMAHRIPKIRIKCMGCPIRISVQTQSNETKSILVDFDDWLDAQNYGGTGFDEDESDCPTIEVTNCSDWRAYSFAGLSLIFIWQ